MNIFRFKRDQEFGKVRAMKAGMTPATVRLHTTMKPNDKATSLKLNASAIAYLKRINTKKALQYLSGTHGGWVNEGEFPKVEQLTFEYNQFAGYQYDKIWTVVYTWKFNEPFSQAFNVLRDGVYIHTDYFIQYWWNIKRNGVLMPGKTFKDQSKIIMISANGYLFVENYKVELVK